MLEVIVLFVVLYFLAGWWSNLPKKRKRVRVRIL